MTLLAFAAPLPAQLSQGNYDRAANYQATVNGKVFRAHVQPHWLSDGNRMWYRNELEGGKTEFILVDVIRGTRQPAFDHEKLAAAFSKAVGKTVSPQKLPIDRLSFPQDQGSVVLLAAERGWKCDLQTYALTELKPGEFDSTQLPQTKLHASKSKGDETRVLFINQTGDTVNIYWIDFSGKRQSFGSIKPGARHSQHTFAGHVWVVTDAQGKTLSVVEAAQEAGTVILGDTKAATQPAAAPLRPAKASRKSAASSPPRPSGPQSPDGKWTAFVKDHNVYVRGTGDNKDKSEFALSNDGTEESQYSGEFHWSPDSSRLLAVRVTKGDERKVYYVESSPKDQLQPKLHSYDYLKPGDKLPIYRPQLFDLATRKKIPVSEALWPNPWSVGDIRWAGDSKSYTFLYNQRGHQALRILRVDAGSGEIKPVVDERSETFIDYSGKMFLRYLDETGEVLWMSERDGWNHLYLYDARTGTVKCQVTKGPWVVRAVDRVDEEKRQIWFRAGGIRPGQDPYYIHYCRVNFDGTGLTILTEGDGTHSVEYSPDGRFFLDTWSRVNQPPVSELRRTEDGKLICVLERADWSALLATGWKTPEPFVAKGRDGQTDIYGVIYRPSNFDPNRRYPILEHIYAGPHDSFVPKAFSAFNGMQNLAELGFVLVQIDGMGTSNRSKKFHDVCWKNLSDGGFPDRIAWIKAAAAKYPYMDATRVGVYGGSAGGQNAASAVINFGDFYKAAAADCGCHDNRMDKIWWNEQWMGLMGPHYAEQSNVTRAHKLQGKLLLTVGEMDENVDPASTMQVVNALIKANKDFEMIVFPGKGHGSCESAYGKRRRAEFFVRNLMP